MKGEISMKGVTLIVRTIRPLDDCINRIGKKTSTPPEEIEKLRGKIVKFVESFSETSDNPTTTLDLQSSTLLNISLTSNLHGIEKRYFARFIKEDNVWCQVHTWFDPRLHDTVGE